MPEIQKVTDPQRIVTDGVVLKELARQGIDKDYVEFFQDYAPRWQGKGHSPYAKFYRDLKSGKRIMVASGLPMVKAMGHKIEAGWLYANDKYYSKANLFSAIVEGKQVKLTCLSDQPTGAKNGDRTTWLPQLFLGGVEQSCGEATLLPTDPVNENYLENTLEWDYGICKRRIRLIEGRLRERWVFNSNPNGEVRIKHNFSGTLPVKLGEYAINDDEELVPTSVFNDAEYPVEIGADLTVYPDASPESSTVDGHIYEETTLSWTNLRNAAGESYDDSGLYLYAYIYSADSPNWYRFNRSIMLFDTSALGSGATISAAVLSIAGFWKQDGFSDTPESVICSSNPASNTALVAGDFDSLGDTAFSSGVAYADWTEDDSYNDHTFNATGRAAIDKTGISKFGWRESHDLTNSEPPWAAWTREAFGGWSSDKGAGYKPKLVVTYTLPQTVIPSAITSSEAFGTAKLNLKLEPSAIASAEAFGTAKLNLKLEPSGIASAEAFGSPVIAGPIIVTGIPSAEAFGTPTVFRGLQYLLPSSIVSAEAFGSPQLNLKLEPSAIASGEAFGTAKLVLYLTPTGIASGELFGTPQLNLFITPTGIVSSEAFGALTIIPGEVFVIPSAIASLEAFGTPKLGLYLRPSSIVSLEAFGTPQLNLIIFPDSVASAEAFGTPRLGLYLLPSAIASGEAFGIPRLGLHLLPSSIVSEEAFGLPQLNLRLFPSAIASAEAFGTPKILWELFLLPSSIASAEAFGTPRLVLYLLPTSIASAELFGTPNLYVILAVGDGMKLPTDKGQAAIFHE